MDESHIMKLGQRGSHESLESRVQIQILFDAQRGMCCPGIMQERLSECSKLRIFVHSTLMQISQLCHIFGVVSNYVSCHHGGTHAQHTVVGYCEDVQAIDMRFIRNRSFPRPTCCQAACS